MAAFFVLRDDDERWALGDGFLGLLIFALPLAPPL